MSLFFNICSLSASFFSIYLSYHGLDEAIECVILSFVLLALGKLHDDRKYNEADMSKKRLEVHLLKRDLGLAQRNDMPKDKVTGQFTKKKK